MDPTTAVSARILLVEDDEAVREIMRRVLCAAHYDVTEVENGVAALQALREHQFDLVLLDVHLPGKTGLEVLEQMRDVAQAPRVIMVTGDAAPDTILRAARGQAYRYVTKPFAPTGLLEIVAEALAAPPLLPIKVISARPDWVELELPCSLDAADRVRNYVMHLGSALAPDVREAVAQAFRELLYNAVEWGGQLDATRTVRICYIRTRRMILYRITDPGSGFDMDALTHAAICNPAENPLQHAIVREEKGLRPGGLGLALTRALVDELIFNERRNEVIFVKYLD